MTFWGKELMKSVVQNIWEKLKRQIFLIFVIFHIRKVPCLLKPLLWTSASPYFDSLCFRQCRRHRDTLSLLILVIMFSESCFFGDLSQVFLNRCERRYPYTKGRNSGAFQTILWKQVVTCSAHSKKHFKTNLAEYCEGGGGHGRANYLPDYCLVSTHVWQVTHALMWSVNLWYNFGG